ncbi:hypothetical protein [Lentilactobacillus farraginis]|uniref:Uncharacterized protein n=1 Tax=Lentilactobacillus farraginis DSM 18382 = JCM 14108 TaxID=1423743 RepID=X0PKE1_9LACO|nr:hypothetical protein [Lentilactobacillus farraginis]KRM07839.1 hypothetical protein FD41_GL000315 [Lentilactobacillus farraginis DSM 18382 = JCM 14108]GAF37111.1 hypothetical protein JCM14108_2120 [Lentilactobacillus farraginis DSM 18382 = JCM 14108]
MSRKIQINLSELDHTRSCRIIDEYKDTKYLIVGKWGLVSDTFSVYSITGDVLAEARQQSLGTTPRFDLFCVGQFVGSSVLHFSMHYTTLFINGINWLVIGNQEKQSYTITHGRQKIATIKSYAQADQIIRIMAVENINHEPIVALIAAILNHPSLVHTANLKLPALDKYLKGTKAKPEWGEFHFFKK